MHIKFKNNKLIFDKYRIKCAIGKRGISSKKIEGDQKTPKGTYRLMYYFYRKDRIKKPFSKLKAFIIKKNQGWCDDPRSLKYNQLIKRPYKYKHEKLYRKDNIYDILIVLNYNINPIIKNKGSAIFLHIAKKNFSPTAGCLAISKKFIKILIEKINNKTKLYIY